MDLKILSETAAALFVEHRMAGWTFGLADSKRRLGVCKYRRKRIEISEWCSTRDSGPLQHPIQVHW